MNCPKCNTPCDRDEVDVGVGVIYGPYGCNACGWSEDSRYDSSEGPSPKQLEYPEHLVDSRGGLTPVRRDRAGRDVTDLPGLWDESDLQIATENHWCPDCDMPRECRRLSLTCVECLECSELIPTPVPSDHVENQ